jgi:hypothetical protein
MTMNLAHDMPNVLAKLVLQLDLFSKNPIGFVQQTYTVSVKNIPISSEIMLSHVTWVLE